MTPRARHRVDARLERIEHATAYLSGLALEARELVIGSVEKVAAMERMLEVAVQAAIDVASQLIATHGWKTPESYGESFGELALRGVLDPELAERLRAAAALRNLLAHDYLDVDARRLHASLPADLEDLAAFIRAVLGWLERDTDPSATG